MNKLNKINYNHKIDIEIYIIQAIFILISILKTKYLYIFEK